MPEYVIIVSLFKPALLQRSAQEADKARKGGTTEERGGHEKRSHQGTWPMSTSAVCLHF